MTRLPGALVLAASLFCATAVRAATPPTPVPDMKPDLSSMSYLLGTWSCHAQVRGTHRPDTFTTTMDYDGRWMKMHDTAPSFDKFRSRAITTDTWMTYNKQMHDWVQTSVDNFGGYYMATSPGWHGKSITWTATVTPDGSTGSDTTTKDSDTQTTDVATGKDKNGKPLPTTTTACTKNK